MAKVFVGVGSNLGKREENIKHVRRVLDENRRIKFVKASKNYETKPHDAPPQPYFLNAVFEIETGLEPEELLNELLKIEKRLGRVRKEKNGPRIIDLDILFYGDLVYESSSLLIPHPKIAERLFVLEPFCEMEPDYVHPVKGLTVSELRDEIQMAMPQEK